MTTRLPLMTILAGAAVLVLVNGAAPWSYATANALDNAMQLAAGTTAVVTGVISGLRRRGSERTWRLLIATGMAAWTGGLIIWSWYQIVDGEGLPSPSLADAGFLAYPVFGLAAMSVLGRAAARNAQPVDGQRGRHGYRSVELVLDGLIVTASLFFLSWSGALGTIVTAGAPDRVTLAVALAYPVTDLVMVVVAVLMVVFGRIREADRAGFQFLIAGVVALATSDSIYAYLISVDAATMTPWENAGFVIGPLLVACAVLERGSGGGAAVRPVENADRWALGLPYLGLAAVGAVVIGRWVTGHEINLDPVTTVTGLLVVTLVIVNQLLTALHNRRLINRVYANQHLLLHLAYHDSLTGLANRLSFARRLDGALASHQPLSLVLVDIDDFKDVNDRFGHAEGDRLLCEVGTRLQATVSPRDTVARIGGDEFAILVVGEPATATELVSRIRAALRTPVAVKDVQVRLRVSMGVVLPDVDEPFLDGDVLLSRADASMYAGKRTGKDTVVIYRPALGDAPDFPSALRAAFGERPVGFFMVYQPVVRLLDGEVVGFEALARWKAADGSDVEPGIFVPSAERAGLGRVLDTMVVNAVCGEIADLPPHLTVHVNVGAARLGDLAFESAVQETLSTHHVPPGRLLFEITETEAVANLGEAAAAIRRLQSLGIRLALDDFGTGYNSLNYLHELPVDVIKLDRSMTEWVAPQNDVRLYRSLIGICGEMGLDVIAEGIETEESAARVRQMGCGYGQGYHFGRPKVLGAVSGASEGSGVGGLGRERDDLA
ncbi:bifunctional diguanylate cyclase/phosphodiesterase [Mycobacterium sp. Root135]|uniref:putative bifunctional diguanylate cyclase/phosphodiesterase n=1 Tax=Mycobacterium sp. Root135 TaxID=1736457 RepID=UPI001910EF58|nr:EAL domain-containing protein [Mycobacterium sp. Root135]